MQNHGCLTLIIDVMSSNGVHNMGFSGIWWLWLVRHSICTDVMNFNVGFELSGQHLVIYTALSFHYPQPVLILGSIDYCITRNYKTTDFNPPFQLLLKTLTMLLVGWHWLQQSLFVNTDAWACRCCCYSVCSGVKTKQTLAYPPICFWEVCTIPSGIECGL